MWVYYRHAERPDSLKEKIEAFQRRGLVPDYNDGLFLAPSWLSVLIGQNIYPNGYDPRVDQVSNETVKEGLGFMRQTISDTVENTQGHIDFIKAYGAVYHHQVE